MRARTLVFVLALAGTGCDEDGPERRENDPDAAEPEPDAASGPAEDAGPSGPDSGIDDDAGADAAPPQVLGGLTIDTPAAEHQLDLFGDPGHRVWVEVSEKQLGYINFAGGGGPGPVRKDIPIDPFPPGGNNGDPYSPGVDLTTYADHVVVQDVRSQRVADYGKVEVALVGESTLRAWDIANIPNLRFDMDQFQTGLRLGGFEHLRLNNGQVGSIFREAIAHRIYRELGYPALRASFAFLGSNVWGENIWIPMVLMEVYKHKFCDDNAELLGGSCTNMWEFAGEAGNQGELPPSACQVKTCDNTRMNELGALLAETTPGEGFKAALDPIIDWQRFHEFQCISWILWTGDDALHNGNNNLIIERDADHKLIWAPYSIDISAGQEWYQNVSLYGTGPIANGCQQDPVCWADTVAVCADLVQKFDALNPETFVDETVATLTDLGMMRAGDEQRAALLRDWYVTRQEVLPAELVVFSEQPGEDGCPQSLERCPDESCGTPEECATRLCSGGLEWCETLGFCISPGEPCPSCEDPEPFYCRVNGACMASVEVCAEECAPGEKYCADEGYCTPVELQCGGIFELPRPLKRR